MQFWGTNKMEINDSTDTEEQENYFNKQKQP